MNIEDHIRKAVEEGKFKDLPGKGKPLNLEENPFEDPEWRTAFKMLKDGGFSLPWIELRKEIETEIEAARKDFHTAWEDFQSSLSQPNQKGDPRGEWERARNRFLERLAAINKKVFSYNMQTPSMQFQMLPLDVKKELEYTNNPNKGLDS